MEVWENIAPRITLLGDQKEGSKWVHFGQELIRTLRFDNGVVSLFQNQTRKAIPGGGYVKARIYNNIPDIEIYVPPPEGEPVPEEQKEKIVEEFLFLKVGHTLETSVFAIWDIKTNKAHVLKDDDGNDVLFPCTYNKYVQAFIDGTESLGAPLYTPETLLVASNPWGSEIVAGDLYRDYSSDVRINWGTFDPGIYHQAEGATDKYESDNILIPYPEAWEWTTRIDRDYTKTSIVCIHPTSEGDGSTSMRYDMSAISARADVNQWSGWGDIIPGTTKEWGFLGSARLGNEYFATIIDRSEFFRDSHDWEHFTWDCVAYWYPDWIYGCAWYRSGIFSGVGGGDMTVKIKTPLGESTLYYWPMYKADYETYNEDTYWYYDGCYYIYDPETINLRKGYKQTGGIVLERETLINPVYAGEVVLTSEIPILPKHGVAFRIPEEKPSPLVDNNPNRACTGATFHAGQWVMGDDVGFNVYGENPLPAASFPRSSQCLGRKDLFTETSRISVYLYFGLSYLEVINHGLAPATMGHYTRRYYQDYFTHAQAVDISEGSPPLERNTALETLIKDTGALYYESLNAYRTHPAYLKGGYQEANNATYDQTYYVEAPLTVGGDVTIQIRGVETEFQIK